MTAANNLVALRVICGVVGVIILIGAAVVRAPALGVLALPGIVAALALRQGRPLARAVVALWAALYVVISVNFAIGNGMDAIWSDLLGVYVGGPLAAVAVVLAVRGIAGQRTATG